MESNGNLIAKINLTYENKSTLDNNERNEEQRQTVDYLVSRRP
jgi:hypothetical protein